MNSIGGRALAPAANDRSGRSGRSQARGYDGRSERLVRIDQEGVARRNVHRQRISCEQLPGAVYRAATDAILLAVARAVRVALVGNALSHRHSVSMCGVRVLRVVGSGYRSAGAGLCRCVMVCAIRRGPHRGDTLHEQCNAQRTMPENSPPIHTGKYRPID